MPLVMSHCPKLSDMTLARCNRDWETIQTVLIPAKKGTFTSLGKRKGMKLGYPNTTGILKLIS